MNYLITITKETETAIKTIQGSWNKTLEFVLQTSKLLIEYQQRDDWVDIKRELISRGIMKDSVISMMMSIGRNELLQSKKNLGVLPNAYNTLYYLSRMDEDDLSNHIKDGHISPSLKLETAKDYYQPSTTTTTTTPSPAKNKDIVKISILSADYAKRKSEIDTLLSEIATKYPFLILSRSK